MQTFLPYADFDSTAKVLDNKRLGKQRVETKQILNALDGLSRGWVNHPATRMWRGYEYALAMYGRAICAEWISRGFKDSLYDFFQDRCIIEHLDCLGNAVPIPSWLGNIAFHESHRSNLLRKYPEHYAQFWTMRDDLPYVWPVK